MNTDDYTPEEIEQLRQQKRESVQRAQKVARERGYRLHPRLAADAEKAPEA